MKSHLIEFDKPFRSIYKNLCGMDEAGRGPLMGPVYAGCVILPDDFKLEDLNDSKKIKEEKRLILAEYIKNKAIAFGVGSVSSEEIDLIGIQNANFKAFQNALKNMEDNFNVIVDMVLLDGNYKNVPLSVYTSIIKGDSKSASIAAASILAKTERDSYVTNVCHIEYPDYGFDQHKGYGTKSHIEKIKELGLTPYHRKSFCKKILEERRENCE